MWITARRLQWVGRLWNSEAGQQKLLRLVGGGEGLSRRCVSGAAECGGMLGGRSALTAARLVVCVY